MHQWDGAQVRPVVGRYHHHGEGTPLCVEGTRRVSETVKEDGDMDSRSAAALLGVSPQASRGELIRAFRARAKVTHPDAFGTNDAFIECRAAFDLLCSPARSQPACQLRERRSWFRPAPESTVNLIDSRAARSSTSSSTIGSMFEQQRRDANGKSFADHLQTQLDRRRTSRSRTLPDDVVC